MPPEKPRIYKIADKMGEGMKIDRIIFQLIGALLPSSVAFAHAGHGDPRWSSSLAHYLAEPEHAIGIVFAGVMGVVLGALFAKRGMRTQPVKARRHTKRIRTPR
jgi:hypothetical protein